MTEIEPSSIGGSPRASTDELGFSIVQDEETGSIVSNNTADETMPPASLDGITTCPGNGNNSEYNSTVVESDVSTTPRTHGFYGKSISMVIEGMKKEIRRSYTIPPLRMREWQQSYWASIVRIKKKKDAELHRLTSMAKRAVNNLQFINEETVRKGNVTKDQWRKVEKTFKRLAPNGHLARENFGECIGMENSKEFADGIFDVLTRRNGQTIRTISKNQFRYFWLQLSNKSFDARLRIFFDMVDDDEDGRITGEDVGKLIRYSATANNLAALMERADEYANLIMEELDEEDLGYIELWQLKALLLQKEKYMGDSKPLRTVNTTIGWLRRLSRTLRSFVDNNWQRSWIILLWLTVLTYLFIWKFLQYRENAAFSVMGYCLCTAKGAAETLKFNMALILFPVSRKTLTWLRSTRARLFIPFNDSINFHKMIACAIAAAVIVHAGSHLICDFPRLANSSPEKFALIASSFDNKKPSYWDLIKGYEGVTGITMVILLAIIFTLATRLAGYNAFWYSHHLIVLVYVLLIVHGFFVFLVKDWTQKTTWMYLCVPILLYIVERIVRTWRSKIRSVKIIKVSELPGDVITIVMTKPQGFKYKSGQYIFLQCPAISKFEWHPFSITSAPGDNFLSVHFNCKGDWTGHLRKKFAESKTPISTTGHFVEDDGIHPRRLPKLRVDGPYGAPAQDYRNYDVLLLVGLGIGVTPFISILRDLLNNASAATDSTTELSTSADSLPSFASTSTPERVNRRTMKVKSVYFYWVTKKPESFEWFKGVMEEVADSDHKDLIEMHNHFTSVYEERDARSTLLTLVQALNHAKRGVDILSGTKVKTHFARPKWKEVFENIATKNPNSTIGVFYCGQPKLAKELKRLSHEMTQTSHTTATRFEFHKELF